MDGNTEIVGKVQLNFDPGLATVLLEQTIELRCGTRGQDRDRGADVKLSGVSRRGPLQRLYLGGHNLEVVFVFHLEPPGHQDRAV